MSEETKTTDDMRAELEAAGVKLRANASDDSILEAYAEFLAEGGNPEPAPELEEAEAALSDLEGEEVSPLEPATDSDGLPVCPLVPDPKQGDKDPRVVAWYREHLSDADFKAKYDHRGIR